MGCFGTCRDYADALKDGQRKRLTKKQIDEKYDKDFEFQQQVLVPLIKSFASEGNKSSKKKKRSKNEINIRSNQ